MWYNSLRGEKWLWIDWILPESFWVILLSVILLMDTQRFADAFEFHWNCGLLYKRKSLWCLCVLEINSYFSQWLPQVTNYVQHRKELSLTHPANKLLLSCPGCVCLRESRWPSSTVIDSLATQTRSLSLYPRRCHRTHLSRWETTFCPILLRSRLAFLIKEMLYICLLLI